MKKHKFSCDDYLIQQQEMAKFGYRHSWHWAFGYDVYHGGRFLGRFKCVSDMMKAVRKHMRKQDKELSGQRKSIRYNLEDVVIINHETGEHATAKPMGA